MVIDDAGLCCFGGKNITALYLDFSGRFIHNAPIILMEMSIKTMMIIVIGVITLLVILAVLSSSQGQSMSLIEGLFEWFRSAGS